MTDSLLQRLQAWNRLEPTECWKRDGIWCCQLTDGNHAIDVTISVPLDLHSDMRLLATIMQLAIHKRGWSFCLWHRPDESGKIKYLTSLYPHDLHCCQAADSPGEAALCAYLDAFVKLRIAA